MIPRLEPLLGFRPNMLARKECVVGGKWGGSHDVAPAVETGLGNMVGGTSSELAKVTFHMAAGAAEVCRLQVIAKHTTRDFKIDVLDTVFGTRMLCHVHEMV
jgi:hypothetical protein